MVTAEGEGQVTLLGMLADGLCNCLADVGDETGVLQFADGRVVLGVDLFKLVVTIETDLPTKLCKLLGQAGFDQVDWSFIDTDLRLGEKDKSPERRENIVVQTWPPLESHGTHVSYASEL